MADAVCADCEIELQRIVTLDFQQAPGTIDLYPSVVATAHGYLVAGVVPRYQFFTFGSGGEFLAAHGVYGSGPKEFRSVASAVVVGDSIWLFDEGNGRCAVADGTLQPTRTLSCIGYFTNVLPYLPGIVAQGVVSSREHVGYHLRLVSPLGEVLPFAETDTVYDIRDVSIFYRAISVAGDSVWVARYNEYEIELWHPEKGLLTSLRRTPPWTDPSTFVDVPEGHNPHPLLHGIHAEGDTLLWVAATVFRTEPPPFGDRIGPLDWHPHIGTVVEAIDPRDGRLIATTSFDDVDLLRSIGGGYWSATRDTADSAVIDVYRMYLVRHPQPSQGGT